MPWLCHEDERNETETNRRMNKYLNMNKEIESLERGKRILEGSKLGRAVLFCLFAFLCCSASAQDISIISFEHKATDLKPRLSPQYDYSGEACAVIRFSTRDTTFMIEANLGIVRRETLPGEILIYVPSGTKRLTIRHDNLFPLRDYDIPMRLEPKNAYHALLITRDKLESQDIFITQFERHPFLTQQTILDKDKEPCAKIRLAVPTNRKWKIEADKGIRKKTATLDDVSLYVPQGTKYLSMKSKNKHLLKNYTIPVPIESSGVYDAVVRVADDDLKSANSNSFRFYTSLGFNMGCLIGPSMTFGLRKQQYHVEIGGVYGLNKTDDFQKYADLNAFFWYRLLRAQARYGYGIKVINSFQAIPMAGVAFNDFHGTATKFEAENRWDLMYGYSFSALTGLRLEYSIDNHIKVQATPEYSISIKKNVDAGVLCWFDETCNRWATGMNLNIGLTYLF